MVCDGSEFEAYMAEVKNMPGIMSESKRDVSFSDSYSIYTSTCLTPISSDIIELICLHGLVVLIVFIFVCGCVCVCDAVADHATLQVFH